MWLAGYFIYDWSDARIKVNSITPGNHTLFADVAFPSQTANPYVASTGHFIEGARFRFLNQPEFLGAPGMLWLDAASGFLYVTGAPAGATAGGDGSCTLAAAPTALQVTDASHISVEGFTIESAQENLVGIANCSFVSVRNCTVRGGMSGIEVVGGHNVTVWLSRWWC